MSMAFPYRIYPNWFGGDTGNAVKELAHGSAARIGWTVRDVRMTGHGFDRRGGHYLDFIVIYSESVTKGSTTNATTAIDSRPDLQVD